MTFEKSLEKYLSQDEIAKLLASFSEKLLKIFPNLKPHPVVENGFLYDKDEYELGKMIFHDLGAYYIQEPSAMLVAHFLDAKPGEVVLDLCASPGGKTVQTALKMQNEGLIIANDLSKSRANILLSNIERMGLSNVVVTSLDFKNYYQKFLNYFDKIILDAPCSGSGMFRKKDEMKDDWTYEKVLKNVTVQKELILMCYSMLEEGGRLVYSTCSYSFEEDEEVIDYLLKNSDAELENIPSFEGEFRSPKFKESVHLFPSHFDGEGHYICLIKKPGVLLSSKLSETRIYRSVLSRGKDKEIQRFLCPTKLPNNFEELCLRPGLFIATQTKDKIIPSHHFSHVEEALDSIELSKEEVQKYVRGETLNKKCPNGFRFVSFMGMNLGVVYSLNGILKNYYPKGLRSTSVNFGF